MVEQLFEIRCPIHGFVTLNQFELDLVGHRYFQRLRRIRQLAWTDLVYPGAMHTRFEHSLGVMHGATLMFDELWTRRRNELETLGFAEAHREKDRAVMRIMALLHDIGHSPFSHAGEELMPKGPKGPYKHEDYSSALIRRMTEAIDHHPLNKRGLQIKASEIADTLDGNTNAGWSNLFWRELTSGQLDADRADYLLRDSHHTGVQYGRYDLDRLLVSLTVARGETDDPVIAVEEGGWHTAEALILARYMMFSQVYFHKTRSIYDKHLADALKAILTREQENTKLEDKSKFPPPTPEFIEQYIAWDDWRVLGLIGSGAAGKAGEVLLNRQHYRLAYESGSVDTKAQVEIPTDEKKRFEVDQRRYEKVKTALGSLVVHEDDAGRSWYKLGSEILIAMGPSGQTNRRLVPLSELSPLVRALKKERVRRLYVRKDDRTKADELVEHALSADAKENGK